MPYSYFYIILFIIGTTKNGVDSISSDCFKFINEHIKLNERPYQVTIFANSDSCSFFPKISSIFQEVLRETPAVIIDLKDTCENTSTATLLTNSTNISINVIFICEVNTLFENVKCYIDFIKWGFPKSERPKLLVISPSDNLISQFDIGKVLKYAWSAKFLDFTIINKHFSHNLYKFICTSQFYNPFNESIVTKILRKNDQIFPDKLIDVNGYNFSMGVIWQDVEQIILQRNNGEIVETTGFKFPLTSTVLKVMNFSFKYVEVGINMTYPESEKRLVNILENNVVNLGAIPKKEYGNEGVMFRNIIRVDMESNCEPLLAMVPIIYALQFHFPGSLKFFCIVPFVVIAKVYLLKYLKIYREKITVFEIVQVLFGISVNSQPKKVVDRILFSSILLLSVAYTMNSFSDFLDIKLEDGEVSFDTYESIEKSGLQIYVFSGYYNYVFWQNDPHIKGMQQNTEAVGYIEPLIQKLTEGKNHICLDTNNFLEIFKNRSRFPMQNAKIAKPVFNCLRLMYNFERSSPYATKFKTILRRLYEGGINDFLEYSYKNQTDLSYTDGGSVKKNLFVMNLVAILLCGYFVSSVAFFAEYIVMIFFKNKRGKKRVQFMY